MPPHRSGISKSVGVSSPPLTTTESSLTGVSTFRVRCFAGLCAWFRVLTSGEHGQFQSWHGDRICFSLCSPYWRCLKGFPFPGIDPRRFQVFKERRAVRPFAVPRKSLRWSELSRIVFISSTRNVIYFCELTRQFSVTFSESVGYDSVYPVRIYSNYREGIPWRRSRRHRQHGRK